MTTDLWVSLYWRSVAVGRFTLGIAVERVGADCLLRLCTLGALGGTVLYVAGPVQASLPGLVLAGRALAPVFPTSIARGAERVGGAVVVHVVGFKVAAGMLGSAAVPAL